MDFLRFGYRAKMRTINGQPPVDVVWYRAADDAPLIKVPNVFGSRVWEDPHFNDDIGEQSEGGICCGKQHIDWRRWNKPEAASIGPHPCGSDAVAGEGAGPGDPTFLTNPDGSAPCCGEVPPAVHWQIGIGQLPLIGPAWRRYGTFPPVGVTVHWEDDQGHSGSFVSTGEFFEDVPYGFFGIAHYDVIFFVDTDPPDAWMQVFLGGVTETWYNWGLNHCSWNWVGVPGPSSVQMHWTW